jgi:heptaprenyl diphosphate synthase
MITEKARAYLEKGYDMMTEFGFPPSRASLNNAALARTAETLSGAAGAAEIAAALQALFVARKLFDIGGRDDRARMLLADYFAGLAVKLLSPLRSDRILRRMTSRLKSTVASDDALATELDAGEYLDWTNRVCKEYLADARGRKQAPAPAGRAEEERPSCPSPSSRPSRPSGAERALGVRLAEMEALFRERFAARAANGREPDAESEEMGKQVYDVLMSGGKRLRPRLVSVTSGFGRPAGEAVVDMMAAVEIIHTSSLIHDDIIDDSVRRRGRPTISALKGDAYATRCGYFLIAEAIDILRPHMDAGVTELIADIVIDMCLGELRQLKVERDFSLQSPDDYFLRIERKTARLIEGSCRLGGRIGGSDPDHENALGAYGRALGIVFQLRDDLLDCGLLSVEKKPLYQDLRRGVYTLPLLYAADHDPGGRLLRLFAKDGKTPEDLRAIFACVDEAGGVEYTRDKMTEYTKLALTALEDLPDTDERAFLAGTVLELNESGRSGWKTKH